MFEKLYNYFLGTVRIEIKGEFPERLLNLCSQNNISFKELTKDKDCLYINLNIKDYKKIRFLKRNTKNKVKIINKKGLPFIIKKYGFRPGIPVGIVMFILILNIFSSFIWSFNIVTTSEKLDKSDIINRCKILGISEGVSKKALSKRDLANELILISDDIAWASFNIQGSTLEINLTDITDADKLKTPSNLRAKSDGKVKKLDITSGTPLVKVGDTVAKGQILVSGVVEVANETRFVRSSGTVTAQINMDFEYVFDEYFETKNYYKTEKHTVLHFFNLKIPLYLGRIHSRADIEKSENVLTVMGKNTPLKISTSSFNEYVYSYELLDDETAFEKAKNKLSEELENLNIKDAIISRKNTSYNAGQYTVKFSVICSDNIVNEDFLTINDAK